jgi:hypothetical protein
MFVKLYLIIGFGAKNIVALETPQRSIRLAGFSTFNAIFLENYIVDDPIKIINHN